ncbi:MAG: hypothetical protein IAE91_11585 [Ignavibacteriaceae bacterium]|nr:hypothetical protein [Ignavibacteriaceae bacterium]
MSEVSVFTLSKILDRSTFIYGPVLMNISKTLISKFIGDEKLEEKNYLSLIENYFIELQKVGANLKSEFLEFILNLEFENVGKFSLIEEKGSDKQIFLLLNHEARILWNNYKEIIESDLPSYTKKLNLKVNKAKFYDYVISVRLNEDAAQNIFQKEAEYGFYVWDRENDDTFYIYDSSNLNLSTGFNRNFSSL